MSDSTPPSEIPIIPTHYRVDDAGVAWRVADEEAVVLHADTSAYFGLNQTGTVLWSRLAERSMTVDQLATLMRSSFSDAPGDLETQIAGFLDELLALGLIESTDSHDGKRSEVTDAATGIASQVWETPTVQRFGELEKLILSAE